MLYSSHLCVEKRYLAVAISHPDPTTAPPRNTPYIVLINPHTIVIMVDFLFGSGGPGPGVGCSGVGGGVGGGGGAGGSFDLVGVLAGFIDQLIKCRFSIEISIILTLLPYI
jgi:hypothetical protein